MLDGNGHSHQGPELAEDGSNCRMAAQSEQLLEVTRPVPAHCLRVGSSSEPHAFNQCSLAVVIIRKYIKLLPFA